MVSSLHCIYLSGTSTPIPPCTRRTLSPEIKSRRRVSKGQRQSLPESYCCVLALVPCGLFVVCIGGFTRDFPQDLSHNSLNISDTPSSQQLLPTFSTLFLAGNTFQATFLSSFSKLAPGYSSHWIYWKYAPFFSYKPGGQATH